MQISDGLCSVTIATTKWFPSFCAQSKNVFNHHRFKLNIVNGTRMFIHLNFDWFRHFLLWAIFANATATNIMVAISLNSTVAMASFSRLKYYHAYRIKIETKSWSTIMKSLVGKTQWRFIRSTSHGICFFIFHTQKYNEHKENYKNTINIFFE